MSEDMISKEFVRIMIMRKIHVHMNNKDPQEIKDAIIQALSFIHDRLESA